VSWPRLPRPPGEAPNVVIVVIDDMGFGDLGCFGGLGGRVATPHIDALAQAGLRYNNFHVNPMCSPTRAALLTGRNCHSVSVGSIMELASGRSGYHGHIPKSAAMLPAVLANAGYATMALGKWHLAPVEDITPIGPFDRWPLGQGFGRFYGFLAAETDQYRPTLYQDNHRVATPSGRYHLSEDLADHALAWVAEHLATAPRRPFFLYLAFGAMHQPHQVWPEWSGPYRGRFQAGWDQVRRETLERQVSLGVVPAGTALPPPNPGVPAWDDLSDAERQLVERQAEVYAGFLSHTDHQVGRLLEALDRHGVAHNTWLALLSDNGATAEGGPLGTRSPVPEENGQPDPLEAKLAALAGWGGPGTSPCYAAGWAMAGNTPNRWYKQFTHEGGTRAPLVVHWPAGTTAHEVVRSQFHHVTDIMPTVLELAGIEMPSQVAGHHQRPLEGVSFAYTFSSPRAPTTKQEQYFEMVGHRAIWAGGWKAVTTHWSARMDRFVPQRAEPPHDGDFDADRWELYDLDNDFSESRDLAHQHPDKLAELVSRWWAAARRHQVLPLSEQLQVQDRPEAIFEDREEHVYYGPLHLDEAASPDLHDRPHLITAVLELPTSEAQGVVASDGGPEGGWCLCIRDGRAHYVANFLGRQVSVVTASQPLRAGRTTLRAEVTVPAPGRARVAMSVDGSHSAPAEVRGANPVSYDVRGRGLRIGADPVGVWAAYEPPFPFTGRIVEVRVRCAGKAPAAAATRARAALKEQ